MVNFLDASTADLGRLIDKYIIPRPLAKVIPAIPPTSVAPGLGAYYDESVQMATPESRAKMGQDVQKLVNGILAYNPTADKQQREFDALRRKYRITDEADALLSPTGEGGDLYAQWMASQGRANQSGVDEKTGAPVSSNTTESRLPFDAWKQAQLRKKMNLYGLGEPVMPPEGKTEDELLGESRGAYRSQAASDALAARQRMLESYLQMSGYNDMTAPPKLPARRPEVGPRPDIQVPPAAEVVDTDYSEAMGDLERAKPASPQTIDAAVYALLGGLGQLGQNPDAGVGQIIGSMAGGAARGGLQGMERNATSKERYDARLADYYLQSAGTKGKIAEGKAGTQNTRNERGRGVQVEQNAETLARAQDARDLRNRGVDEDLGYYSAEATAVNNANTTALRRGQAGLGAMKAYTSASGSPADTALLGKLASEVANGRIALPGVDIAKLSAQAASIAQANPAMASLGPAGVKTILAQLVLQQLAANPQALAMARGTWRNGLGAPSANPADFAEID